MREGWITKPLGQLCRIEIGGTPRRSNSKFWDEKRTTDNVWVSIADMPKTLHARISTSAEHLSDEGAKRVKLVKAGTLLASFKLTLGRLAYADIDLRTNEAIAALTVLDDSLLDQKYLYWFLTFFDWEKAAEGDVKIKGKTLNKAKLKQLPILLPSVSQQQIIVAILDEAFAGLAAATANAERNLKNARELFESYLSLVFAKKRDGWIERTIGECIKVSSGDFLPQKKMKPGSIDVYGGNGVVGQHNEANLHGENVIIGRVGAKCGNVRAVAGDIWLTDNALYVSSYLHPFDRRFLAYLLSLKDLRSTANQAAQPVISHTTIKNVMLSFPTSLHEQQKIVLQLDEIESEAERLADMYRRKMATIDDLEQCILQKAFSGQLTSPPSQAIRDAAE